MKATEIVRRIDDLGRVVIPKVLRVHLRIREGEYAVDNIVTKGEHLPLTDGARAENGA